jgi:hypothetical protein
MRGIPFGEILLSIEHDLLAFLTPMFSFAGHTLHFWGMASSLGRLRFGGARYLMMIWHVC